MTRTFQHLILLLVAVLGCCQSSAMITLQTSGGEELPVKVEIADTAQERSRGLMFRDSLPEGTGMLFLFPDETQGSFWMKDTPISLDLVFIRDGRIVDVIENAVPYSEELLTPESSYTMVLEVPGGYAARHGVKTGDTVVVEGLN